MPAIISTPSPGASDWSDFITQAEKQRKGFISVSLTNFDTTSVPQVAAGSVVEIGLSLYQSTAADDINGSLTSDATNYILLDTSTPEFQWTATAPTWSDDKQGWYDAGESYRYVGGCYYDGSDYTEKFVYRNDHKRHQSGEKIEYVSSTVGYGESTVYGYRTALLNAQTGEHYHSFYVYFLVGTAGYHSIDSDVSTIPTFAPDPPIVPGLPYGATVDRIIIGHFLNSTGTLGYDISAHTGTLETTTTYGASWTEVLAATEKASHSATCEEAYVDTSDITFDDYTKVLRLTINAKNMSGGGDKGVIKYVTLRYKVAQLSDMA